MFPSLQQPRKRVWGHLAARRVLGWSSLFESPEKLILYRADFSLRDSEKLGDFFYCIIPTIDAEAHSDDSLFLQRQRGQELSGFVLRMIHIRQSRFPRLKLPRSINSLPVTMARRSPMKLSHAAALPRRSGDHLFQE